MAALRPPFWSLLRSFFETLHSLGTVSPLRGIFEEGSWKGTSAGEIGVLQPRLRGTVPVGLRPGSQTEEKV